MNEDDRTSYLDQLHNVSNMIAEAKTSYLKAKVVDASAKDQIHLQTPSPFTIQLLLYVMSLLLFWRDDWQNPGWVWK